MLQVLVLHPLVVMAVTCLESWRVSLRKKRLPWWKLYLSSSWDASAFPVYFVKDVEMDGGYITEAQAQAGKPTRATMALSSAGAHTNTPDM